MLAAAFNGAVLPTSDEPSLTRAFLIAFGGIFIGYGLAFSLKYPPHQMIFAFVGMFAAQAWDPAAALAC